MKIRLRLFKVLFLIFPALFLVSCTAPAPRYEKLLGTVCFVNLFEDGKEDYYDEIFARLKAIDNEFNLSKGFSDLYRLNTFGGSKDVGVSEDVVKVLEASQKVSEITGGAFDVSIGPFVKLWRVNTDYPHVASQEEIDEIHPLVDYRKIFLNSQEHTVRFAETGMSLNFGGIAKGYAADEIVKICEKHKISKAVIDLGGNIYVYGKKSKKELWNVGIKNPESPDSMPLIKISVPQISVVTSGVYERYFDVGKKHYHHILSPFTGAPVENDLSSVTVISENSMLADALTTAFFIIGKEESLRLIPTLQKEFNAEFSAIFIEKNHTITLSKDFPYSSSILYEGWEQVVSPS